MHMFPLCRVLFPGEIIPLRVFEPRYVTMMGEVLAGPREFGVVLIERGWEVGGADERTDVGCVAAVEDAAVLGEGHFAVVARGTRRVRVETWLEDDPYPRASVVPATDGAAFASDDVLDALRQRLETVYALASELRADVTNSDLAPHGDRDAALWHYCSLAPVGDLDRQRLLASPSQVVRAGLLESLLVDLADELTLRLGES